MSNKEKRPAPDPNALFYRRTREDGRTQIAKVETFWEEEGGNWHGTFSVPGWSRENINQHNSPLAGWEPVRAVSEENLDEFVEMVAQQVVAILQEQGASPSKKVAAGMKVATSKTVKKAVDTAVEEAAPKRKRGRPRKTAAKSA